VPAPPSRARLLRARLPAAAALAVAALTLSIAGPATGAAGDPANTKPDARVTLDRTPAAPAPQPGGGGRIPRQFVGLSVEWSLIERYMNANARPAFANLLANLGTGVLRIGGSSQDLMQYDPAAPNTERVITPDDLAAIRATLEATAALDPDTRGAGRGTPGWGTILGTALAPPEEVRPWVGPDHAVAFSNGAAQAVTGAARRAVVSIGLGNEPDLTYDGDLAHYLADLAAYTSAGAGRPFAVDLPSTSEPILPWQTIASRSVPTRFFWDWPAILDAVGPATKAIRASAGLATTDHFYPMARGCASDAYRCATIERLLSEDRMANFAYQVHTHAAEATQRGLAYRLGELNTVAGRGADGVSNVAASATWALDAMFTAACPQPPDRPGTNNACGTGAIGVNFHNAEVNRFFAPEEGNAFYNAIDYDPSPAAGAPSAAPEYYALLFFARFAQDTRGLFPVPVKVADPGAEGSVKAWRMRGPKRTDRLVLINKRAQATSVDLQVAGSAKAAVSRMAPYDPPGSGRTLDAPQVRIDGRSVGADGRWPGFAPTSEQADRFGHLRLELGAGEAVVVTPR
jgi:hypothetical protein